MATTTRRRSTAKRTRINVQQVKAGELKAGDRVVLRNRDRVLRVATVRTVTAWRIRVSWEFQLVEDGAVTFGTHLLDLDTDYTETWGVTTDPETRARYTAAWNVPALPGYGFGGYYQPVVRWTI